MVWKATRASGSCPLPLYEHSITTVADKNLYIFGGVMNGVVGNELAVLNTGGLKSWTDVKIRGAPPPPRKGHSSTIIQNNNKDHLLIFGGTDGKSHSFNDTYLLNADTYAWSKPRCTGTLPLPRSNHTAVALDANRVLVFGGRYLVRPLNDVYLFTNANRKNDWSVVKTQGSPPCARYSHCAALWGTKMVVFGGTDGKNLLGDIHILDTVTSTWTQPTVSGSIPPRFGAGAALVDDQFFVFGGEGASGPLNDVYSLDLTRMKWYGCEEATLHEGDEVPPHSGHAFALVGKTLLYAVGGAPGSNVYVLDIKKFMPVEQGDDEALSAPVQKGKNKLAASRTVDEPPLESDTEKGKEKENEKEKEKEIQQPVPLPEPVAPKTTTVKAPVSVPVEPTPLPSVPASAPSGQQTNNMGRSNEKSAASTQLLSNFTALMEEKGKELTELRDRLREREDQLAEEKRQREELRSKVDSLERGREGKDSEARARSSELEELRRRLTELEERAEKASLQAKAEQKAKEEAENFLRAKSRELDAANDALKGEKASQAEQARLRAEAEEKAKRFAEEAEVLRLEVARGSGKQQEEADSTNEQLRRELAGLRVEVAEKTRTTEEQSRDVARLQEELRLLREGADSRRAEAEEAHSSLSRQLRAAEEEVESLRESAARAERARVAAESDKQATAGELLELRAKLDATNQEAVMVKEKLQRETEARQAAELRLASVGRDAEEKAKAASLEEASRLHAAEEELATWRRRFEEAEAARAEIASRLAAGEGKGSSGEVERLTSEVQRLTGEVQRLSSDIQAQVKRTEQEVARREELEQRLVEARAGPQAPSHLQNKIAEYERLLDERAEQIAQLEGEVEQWMVASEQLQKLGEEAVSEVTEEADSLREEVNALTKKYEEEVRRRREVEAELASSEQKLSELDAVLGRLMNIGK